MKFLYLCISVIIIINSGYSQINITNPFEDLAFTKNEGQWVNEEKETHQKIYFGAHVQGKEVFITNKGLVYKYLEYFNEKKGFFEKYFEKKKRKENSEEDDEEEEYYKKGKYVPKYVFVTYQNSNTNFNIVEENKMQSYTCYSSPLNLNQTIKASAFAKVKVSNIYNGIDVEYTLKKQGGFEYNFIVKPFADVNQIKIGYKGVKSFQLNNQNELVCNIDSNRILTETKPIAFNKATLQNINCERTFENNIQQFKLKNYNASLEIVIDPVVFNPSLTTYNRAYDIAKDNAGNVVVFGGLCPYVLKKFSSAGLLLWSFDWTTQPSPPTLYGDFTIDQNDNIFMAQGYPAGRIIKTDPTGVILFNIIQAGASGATELWRMAFNCNYSALRLSGYIQTPGYKQMVNLDPLTGAVIATSTAASDESRALFIDPSGEIYSLTPDQSNSNNPASNYFTKFDASLNSVYRINSGYNTNEMGGIYHSTNYAGPTMPYSNMNAITADFNSSVYTYDGNTIFKRRQSTGALVASISIPTGTTLANSGIVLDPCFNLFVGTSSSVVRLDTNLNIISSLATPAEVYDICLYNGHILATGNGFVNELDFGAICKLTVTTATTANNNCAAPYNGTASVTAVSGGVAPYTYLWNTGATTTSISGLAPGKYWVLTKDSYCGNPKQSVDTVFVINNLLIPTASFNANMSCIGALTTYTDSSTPIAPSSFSVTTWSWDFTTDGILDDFTQNPSFTFPSAGTYTSSLFISSANSCTATITKTVVVNPTPTITVNSSTICLGQQTATLVSAGANTYTWSAGLSATSVATATGAPMATQNYTVFGTDVNGCSSSSTLAITVNALPTVTANSSTICLGQQTATLVAGGANTYTWSAGLSATSGGTVTGTPIATQNYTVVGSDLNGCYGINTSTIFVNPLPVIAVNSSTICLGQQTATLVAGGASTYTWSAGLSSTSGTTVTGTPIATQNYTVTGTDLNNCTNTQTTNIVVNTLPVITVNSSTICLGQQTATLVGGGASTYTWSAGLSSTSGTTVTGTPAATQNYTVTGTDLNGCINTKTTSIQVNPLPTVTVNSGSICSTTNIILTGNGATSYTWQPIATLSSSVGVNVTANPNTTTTYTIIGIDGLGCTNTNTGSVFVIPTPTITTTALPASMCIGLTSNLSAIGAATYTWLPGSIVASTTTVSPISTSVYTVNGANSNGVLTCTSTQTVLVTIIQQTTVGVSPNDSLCLGNSKTISALGGTSYTWSPVTGITNIYGSTTSVNPIVTTIYTVTAIQAGLCPNTATIQMVVNPLPIIDAGRDTTINIDETYVLNGTGDSQIGFLSPTSTPLICNFCPTVEVAPKQTTCYTLQGINGHGCIAYDEVCITVTKDWNIYIPNAFTPNDDLDNEIFIPVGYGIESIELSIFDRWGELIFRSHDGIIGWNGKKQDVQCPQGVYVYKAQIKTMGGKIIDKTGHVTLIGKLK